MGTSLRTLNNLAPNLIARELRGEHPSVLEPLPRLSDTRDILAPRFPFPPASTIVLSGENPHGTM